MKRLRRFLTFIYTDGTLLPHYVTIFCGDQTMAHRMIFKFVFVLAVLLFMVQMGMSNGTGEADFKLNLFNISTKAQPAMMYFIFFGAGLLTGGVLALGGGKSGGSKKRES
jgi:hypothetical protein